MEYWHLYITCQPQDKKYPMLVIQTTNKLQTSQFFKFESVFSIQNLSYKQVKIQVGKWRHKGQTGRVLSHFAITESCKLCSFIVLFMYFKSELFKQTNNMNLWTEMSIQYTVKSLYLTQVIGKNFFVNTRWIKPSHDSQSYISVLY